jgi:hypothetical protein
VSRDLVGRHFQVEDAIKGGHMHQYSEDIIGIGEKRVWMMSDAKTMSILIFDEQHLRFIGFA